MPGDNLMCQRAMSTAGVLGEMGESARCSSLGAHHIRLNFGTTEATLKEALRRMEVAVEEVVERKLTE